MKLHHKIIFMPVLVMVLIFTVSMLGIEYYLNNILQKRFEKELETLSSFALSAVELISYDFDINSLDSSFDLLADRIAQASSVRVSYFSKKGTMLGDSSLSFSEILKAKNHINRIEIIQALESRVGISSRLSETVNKKMIYVAKYDFKTGFIARVSLPSNSYESAIVSIRWGFTVIIMGTIGVIIVFGLFAIRLSHKAVLDERKFQEKRIVANTREITLIQTMSTMLNGANGLDDAQRILSNIMPKLLPDLSGAIYLVNDQHDAIDELTHWGNDWPSDISLLAVNCWQKMKKIPSSKHNNNTVSCINKNCPISENAFCIDLVSDEGLFGVLHLISVEAIIDDDLRFVAIDLAEQISSALANLLLKNMLRDQAIRDPLTGLYNRRFMYEAFEQCINRAERHQNNISVLMIDLDEFKQFNDSFGHEAGDVVLTQVSEEFSTNLRLEDIACRYGGEEFCIICPESSLPDAFALAEKLRDRISQLTLQYQGQSLGIITMSVGISVFPNHGRTSQQLILQADKALYSAKNKGRNCTMVAKDDPSFNTKLS